jgi:hypothetical protein
VLGEAVGSGDEHGHLQAPNDRRQVPDRLDDSGERVPCGEPGGPARRGDVEVPADHPGDDQHAGPARRHPGRVGHAVVDHGGDVDALRRNG